MRSLSERIKVLESAMGDGPNRLTEIHDLIIRPEDGAIVGLYRSVIGGYQYREVTTDDELAEIGYTRNSDGTLSAMHNRGV